MKSDFNCVDQKRLLGFYFQKSNRVFTMHKKMERNGCGFLDVWIQRNGKVNMKSFRFMNEKQGNG